MVKFYTLILIFLIPLVGVAQLSPVTQVTLTFTPGSGQAVTATATDSGNGLMADGTISLLESTEYTLAITLNNGNNDITGEVSALAESLQFFFAPDEDLFEGDATYQDSDSNNLPIGLSTLWTSGCVEGDDLSGDFRLTLNALIGTKAASSSIDDGTLLLDITWDISVANDPDAPECENEEEVIDRVTLTFTPTAGGDPVVAVASDPDGPGPMDLVVEDITLMESTDYELSIMLENTMEGEDITEEIMEEDEDHLFLFAFGEDIFEDPDGDGNIDNRADPVNYNDMDENGLPVGLSTGWTTSCTDEGDATGAFQVVLKHQPGVKSATSGINDGGTDVDITWNITVMDDADAPECENEEEVIDRVTLTFTPTAGGDPVVAVASDPDGPGPMDLVVEDITLMESTDYELSIMLENTMEGEDITEEIMEEDEDHLFLFAFGEDIFEDPDGDGNIDNRADPVNYNDMDENGLPVGLSTGWTTSCTDEGDATGAFQVVLKHQPGVKSATSGINDGGTDVDITWNITVMDDADAPECENEEEVIDRVTLTFTPIAGGDPVVAVASDPDGPGPMDLVVEDITLMESTDYELSIMLENTMEGEDITEEIMEEDEDHLFLFAFGEDIFEDPDGDGNIDNRTDPVNYNDMDENGLPVGLSTDWTTSCTEEGDAAGTFQVVLKHQPGVKSATSGINDGGTDVDITWNITVMDDADAPECENEEEVIDRVTLTFTPTDGGETVVAVASDPDGPGPMDLQAEDINLMENTTYDLAITVENTIEGEDITEEIAEEDEEHQFFFAWTEDIYTDPEGDGNIDNAADPVNYLDMDDNGLPLGLSTRWTTNVAMSTGIFRVALKHQPDIKSATSTFEDGGTDIDISWTVNSVVTSLDNLREDQEFTIAPNPVGEKLFLTTRNLNLESLDFIIHDALGSMVKRIEQPTNAIDLSGLPTGTYVLIARSNELTVTRRFVKMK